MRPSRLTATQGVAISQLKLTSLQPLLAPFSAGYLLAGVFNGQERHLSLLTQQREVLLFGQPSLSRNGDGPKFYTTHFLEPV